MTKKSSHTQPDDTAVRAAILEVHVSAALGGHDLAAFEPVETDAGGYEARCRRCAQTVWVGDDGLLYSLLDDDCAAE